MLEKTIEAYLVKRIKDVGGVAYKFTSPQKRAVPDRLVLLPGGYAKFVELKAPGKKASPAQERELEKLKALGFEALVIDSKEAVDAWVKPI